MGTVQFFDFAYRNLTTPKERKLTMESTVTFVNIFKNVSESSEVSLRLTARIGDIFASSTDIPPMSGIELVKAVTKSGTKCLRSKRPVLLEFANLHQGDKDGVWFFNAVSVKTAPQANQTEILAMFDEPEAKNNMPTQNEEF
jgi:hypothetical protein